MGILSTSKRNRHQHLVYSSHHGTFMPLLHYSNISHKVTSPCYSDSPPLWKSNNFTKGFGVTPSGHSHPGPTIRAQGNNTDLVFFHSRAVIRCNWCPTGMQDKNTHRTEFRGCDGEPLGFPNKETLYALTLGAPSVVSFRHQPLLGLACIRSHPSVWSHPVTDHTGSINLLHSLYLVASDSRSRVWLFFIFLFFAMTYF